MTPCVWGKGWGYNYNGSHCTTWQSDRKAAALLYSAASLNPLTDTGPTCEGPVAGRARQQREGRARQGQATAEAGCSSSAGPLDWLPSVCSASARERALAHAHPCAPSERRRAGCASPLAAPHLCRKAFGARPVRLALCEVGGHPRTGRARKPARTEGLAGTGRAGRASHRAHGGG